jgi:hypothetical protein
LSDNELVFKLNKINQLNLYKKIIGLNNQTLPVSDLSIAYASIYISYTNISFVHHISFNLYDSKCRNCTQGLITINSVIFK